MGNVSSHTPPPIIPYPVYPSPEYTSHDPQMEDYMCPMPYRRPDYRPAQDTRRGFGRDGNGIPNAYGKGDLHHSYNPYASDSARNMRSPYYREDQRNGAHHQPGFVEELDDDNGYDDEMLDQAARPRFRPRKRAPLFTDAEFDTFPAAQRQMNDPTGMNGGGGDPWLDACTCPGICKCRRGTRRMAYRARINGEQVEGVLRVADFDGTERERREKKKKKERVKRKDGMLQGLHHEMGGMNKSFKEAVNDLPERIVEAHRKSKLEKADEKRRQEKVKEDMREEILREEQERKKKPSKEDECADSEAGVQRGGRMPRPYGRGGPPRGMGNGMPIGEQFQDLDGYGDFAPDAFPGGRGTMDAMPGIQRMPNGRLQARRGRMGQMGQFGRVPGQFAQDRYEDGGDADSYFADEHPWRGQGNPDDDFDLGAQRPRRAGGGMARRGLGGPRQMFGGRKGARPDRMDEIDDEDEDYRMMGGLRGGRGPMSEPRLDDFAAFGRDKRKPQRRMPIRDGRGMAEPDWEDAEDVPHSDPQPPPPKQAAKSKASSPAQVKESSLPREPAPEPAPPPPPPPIPPPPSIPAPTPASIPAQTSGQVPMQPQASGIQQGWPPQPQPIDTPMSPQSPYPPFAGNMPPQPPQAQPQPQIQTHQPYPYPQMASDPRLKQPYPYPYPNPYQNSTPQNQQPSQQPHIFPPQAAHQPFNPRIQPIQNPRNPPHYAPGHPGPGLPHDFPPPHQQTPYRQTFDSNPGPDPKLSAFNTMHPNPNNPSSHPWPHAPDPRQPFPPGYPGPTAMHTNTNMPPQQAMYPGQNLYHSMDRDSDASPRHYGPKEGEEGWRRRDGSEQWQQKGEGEGLGERRGGGGSPREKGLGGKGSQRGEKGNGKGEGKGEGVRDV